LASQGLGTRCQHSLQKYRGTTLLWEGERERNKERGKVKDVCVRVREKVRPREREKAAKERRPNLLPQSLAPQAMERG